MDTQSLDQKVKEIKQSFRQMMDGATAQSMRQKGLDYHLNWGATIPRLREMSEEVKVNSVKFATATETTAETNSTLYALSSKLWKENVRECKILATMLMPPDEMLPEVADIWMEQTPTVEIAEQAAFNLYQHLPYAADTAFLWLASPDNLPQLCGYHILSRLFMHKQEFNERAINEFLDQAITAIQSASISTEGAATNVCPPSALQKAAMQAVIHFAGMSIMHERLAKSAIRSIGLSFL